MEEHEYSYEERHIMWRSRQTRRIHTTYEYERDQPQIAPTSKLWYIKDKIGISCVVGTWLLMLYAEFIVMVVILLPTSNAYPTFANANIVFFQVLMFLALVAHIRTIFTNPGAVPIGNNSVRDGEIIGECERCDAFQPERAYHCHVCQRCIRKVDDHCYWVNNCVGECNRKFFVLFTLYISAASIHSSILCICQIIYCIIPGWGHCTQDAVLLMLFLVCVMLPFSCCTIIMFATQIFCILHDVTFVELVEDEEIRWVRESEFDSVRSLQAVFGRFYIMWFLPLHAPTPNAI